jgi:hypothetical protein
MSGTAMVEDHCFAQGDVVLDGGWSVVRTIRIPGGEIRIVAVEEGYGWKATVDAPSDLSRLEFHGLFPKLALDQAEGFIRKRIASQGSL